MNEIRDSDGTVIGTVEAVTKAKARFDVEQGRLRIRSTREDEIAAMDDQTLEEELSVYLSRLMC